MRNSKYFSIPEVSTGSTLLAVILITCTFVILLLIYIGFQNHWIYYTILMIFCGIYLFLVIFSIKIVMAIWKMNPYALFSKEPEIFKKFEDEKNILIQKLKTKEQITNKERKELLDIISKYEKITEKLLNENREMSRELDIFRALRQFWASLGPGIWGEKVEKS